MRGPEQKTPVVVGGGGVPGLLREVVFAERGRENVVTGTVQEIESLHRAGSLAGFALVSQHALSPAEVATVDGWAVPRLVLVDVAPEPHPRLAISKLNHVGPDHPAIKRAMADLNGDRRELHAFCRYLDLPD